MLSLKITRNVKNWWKITLRAFVMSHVRNNTELQKVIIKIPSTSSNFCGGIPIYGNELPPFDDRSEITYFVKHDKWHVEMWSWISLSSFFKKRQKRKWGIIMRNINLSPLVMYKSSCTPFSFWTDTLTHHYDRDLLPLENSISQEQAQRRQ